MSRARLLRLLVTALLAGAAGCGPNATVDASNPDLSLDGSALRGSSLQAIRQIEDHRLVGNAKLKAFLGDKDVQVRSAAATAVGRIGDASLEAAVAPLASDSSPTVRAAAAFALGLFGDPTAESALDAQFAAEPDTSVRVALLLGLGQAGSATSLPLVTGALFSASYHVQTAAAQAYGNMVARSVAPSSDPAVAAKLIALAAGSQSSLPTAAAYALRRLGAAKVALDEPSLTAALGTAPSEARGYLVVALGTLGTATALQTVAGVAANDADPNVRSAACGALAAFGAQPAGLTALTAALQDPSHAVVVASTNALATLGAGAASLAPALSALFDNSSSAWVRSAALAALVSVAPGSSRSRVLAGLQDVWSVQSVAIAEVPVIANAGDVQTLLTLSASSDLRIASAAIGAFSYLDPSLVTPVTPSAKAVMTTALARQDWEIVLQVTGVAATFGWTDFAPQINALYAQFPGDVNMNARLGITWALGYIGGTADLPLLQSALQDDLVLVAQQAAQSYQMLTGTNVMAQARTQNVVTTRTPSAKEISSALGSLVVLDTTQGQIGIQMVPEAPLNATAFVHLADSGSYNGLTFHRVVPDFVVQGGDPRGDGYGGTTLVRDEWSRVPHEVGAVGMATAGKDTGSCQIFFDETWNARLDQHYTVLGQIVFGIDAARAMEVGDSIQSATVLTGIFGG
jgi:cyclophilin family peptidyl-prolyl cis-trans isomerase/HEAT repeat protein